MRHRLLYVLAVAAASSAVAAQTSYPSRPVKLIVAFAAGSAPDIMARVYGNELKERLGQPVVVDNKPGATGAIGADLVVKAPVDGYTLLLNSSALAINPWVKKQSFDFRRDLVPVARTGDSKYVLTVYPKLPIHNLDDFIGYAKKNPGKLMCATYGVASPPHLALELLKKEAGIDVMHVPYKTFGQVLPDLVSGQVSCSLDPAASVAPHVPTGTVRAVAHTGKGSIEMYPKLDGIGNRFPLATVVGWQAIFAPAATPEPVLARLRKDWQETLKSPAVQKVLRDSGFEPAQGSLDDFKNDIEADYRKFGRVIKENDIRLGSLCTKQFRT